MYVNRGLVVCPRLTPVIDHSVITRGNVQTEGEERRMEGHMGSRGFKVLKGLSSETGSLCRMYFYNRGCCGWDQFKPDAGRTERRSSSSGGGGGAILPDAAKSGHTTPAHSNHCWITAVGFLKTRPWPPPPPLWRTTHLGRCYLLMLHTYVHTLVVYTVSYTASPPAALTDNTVCAWEEFCSVRHFFIPASRKLRLWLSNECLCGFCIVFNLKSDPGRDRNHSVSKKKKKKKRKNPHLEGRSAAKLNVEGRTAKAGPWIYQVRGWEEADTEIRAARNNLHSRLPSPDKKDFKYTEEKKAKMKQNNLEIWEQFKKTKQNKTQQEFAAETLAAAPGSEI